MSQRTRLDYARILVDESCGKSQVQEIPIRGSNEKMIMQKVIYEWDLQKCGRIGHEETACRTKINTKKVAQQNNKVDKPIIDVSKDSEQINDAMQATNGKKDFIPAKDNSQFPPLRAESCQKALGNSVGTGKGIIDNSKFNQKGASSLKAASEQSAGKTSKPGISPSVPPKPGFRGKGNNSNIPHG